MVLLVCAWPCAAQGRKAAKTAPSATDVLVLSNGDILHGKLLDVSAGKVEFHSDPLGKVAIPWSKVKELHTAGRYAVLDDMHKLLSRRAARQIETGTLQMDGQAVTVHPAGQPALPPIPVKQAQFVMDEGMLRTELNRRQGFFAGWSGSASAGMALVAATQNQYTVSGGISLARQAPRVSWLKPRNRILLDFSGSYGKITQPGFFSGGAYVPEAITKSAIYHADAERDEYVSPRFYALAQTAFDHNYGQALALQQVYGSGIGWTILKTRKQEVDLKGTVQYEKQEFLSGAGSSDQNLFGSTFSVNYVLHRKLLNYTQSLAYLPAYTQSVAYSINETNGVTFPAYKHLSFSLGTVDSYLNDPPVSVPPTRRNSFQFTMGLNYSFKLRN